jgi:hypothetical protein
MSGLDLTSSKEDDLHSFKTYDCASDEEADHSSLSSDDEEQQCELTTDTDQTLL